MQHRLVVFVFLVVGFAGHVSLARADRAHVVMKRAKRAEAQRCEDVRDRESLGRAVRGVDVIYHLAAAVGVGQSMYQISDYIAANTLGTANLLQAILDTRSGVPIQQHSSKEHQALVNKVVFEG